MGDKKHGTKKKKPLDFSSFFRCCIPRKYQNQICTQNLRVPVINKSGKNNTKDAKQKVPRVCAQLVYRGQKGCQFSVKLP